MVQVHWVTGLHPLQTASINRVVAHGQNGYYWVSLDPSPVEQCKHPVCPLVRPHRRGEIVQVGRGVRGRGVQQLREARHRGVQ